MYGPGPSQRMLRLAVAGLLVMSLVVVPTQGAWSSFHNDERNTGFQSGTAYQVYEDLWWSKKLKSTQIDGSPVVKDGVMLIGAWDKQVRAIDAESGNPKWNATMKGIVYNTPAIVAGRVFLVDSTGLLEARDLQKGTVLATAQVGATRGSITVHEGKLFIGNEAGVMQAFDTETLTLDWKFTISSLKIPNSAGDCTAAKFAGSGAQIRGAPVVHDGKVIFGSLNGWLYAVDEEGKEGLLTDAMWVFETQDALHASPAIDTVYNRVLIGSYDQRVYALPATAASEGAPDACPALNAPAWQFQVPATIGQSKVHSSIAVDGQRLYFGANNHQVYALALTGPLPAAPHYLWQFSTGGQVVSSPAVSNNIVVVGSDDGKLYWLNATTGARLKDFQADAPIKSSPAIDGDRTFIASFEGSIYMFGKAIPRRPDLRVAGIEYTDGLVSVIVRNTGDGEAPESKLRLTIDGSLIGDLAVPKIAPGAEVTVTQTQTLVKGVHTIVATADQGNVIVEAEENDNARTQKVTLEDAPLDDDDDGDKGGFKIPGIGVPILLGALAALAVLGRRKQP